MCAPRRIFDFRFWIVDWRTAPDCNERVAGFINLKSLGVPVWFLQASFARIFEKLVNRCEQHARALHVEPQIEVEFVIEEMNIAMAEHAEKPAGCFEIVRMNNSVVDLKGRTCLVGDAVSAARDDMIENS